MENKDNTSMNIGFFAGHAHYITHTKLLIKSIFDCFANPVITVVINAVDLETFKEIFNYKGVNILPIEYNSSYPFIDKIYAAAEYENTAKDDFLWIDVDSYFLRPFKPNFDGAIQLNPVDMKNIGVLYGAEFSEIWSFLFKIVNIQKPEQLPCYRTMISGEKIYPYFNVGCVWIHKNRKIFIRTKNIIDEIINNPKFISIIQSNQLNSIFLHQAVFTCSVLENYAFDEIHYLPENMNFPLHLNVKLKEYKKIEELISFRYDTFFESNEEYDHIPEILMKNKEKLNMVWYY